MQRVPVHRDDVGLEPRRDRTDLRRKAQPFGIERRRRHDRVHRWFTRPLNPANQVLGVVAVRSSDRVGAVDDLEPRRRQRHANVRGRERQDALHHREPGVGVVADSLVAGPIVEIVAEYQAALRIEVRSARGHQGEHVLRHEETVLDLGAPSERRRTHRRRAVRVHQRTQADGFCLAARGHKLRVGQRLLPALPDAPRGENLDEVRTLGFVLSYQCPQGIGTEAAVDQRIERRENPRARQPLRRDPVAQVHVAA